MALNIVNPTDRDSWMRTHRYLFAFGAYGETKCLVWSDSLESALDEAIDWLVAHAPGLLFDEQVGEAYIEALAEGKSEDDAREYAEQDMTCGGNCGNYIASWEWSVIEDPSRADVIQARDGSSYHASEPTAAVYHAR